MIFQKQDQQWLSCDFKEAQCHFALFILPLSLHPCPAPLIGIITTPEYIKTHHPSHLIQPPPPEHNVPNTFATYVSTQAQWECKFITNIEFILDKEEIINLFNETFTLFLVSDGGKDEGLGYFGWAIGTHTELL
eukprot:15264629-Ditylum_brightwellii.AAC.1